MGLILKHGTGCPVTYRVTKAQDGTYYTRWQACHPVHFESHENVQVGKLVESVQDDKLSTYKMISFLHTRWQVFIQDDKTFVDDKLSYKMTSFHTRWKACQPVHFESVQDDKLYWSQASPWA